ncbi:MAG: NAD(P)-binding protein [Oscillospiraceae bacterium]|nr:NAD(P)-binding protein [Oscillospiraceae bacterium]
MERLFLKTAQPGENTIEDIYAGLKRRVAAGERGVCPVDLTAVFLRLCQSQSCGKCTPCRVGLDRMTGLLEGMLGGSGSLDDIRLLKRTASAIADSADCAIGFEAAKVVLGCIGTYYKDFETHITTGSCLAKHQAVRCAWNCPAQVDIPGYIALCGEGRYVDAVRLIRKDNPLPSTCALICEHPCEDFCRRGIVDQAVNIRAIKRSAVEKAGVVPPEAGAPSTGKRVAVVGGGPAGLSAAYYLTLMGHQVKIYEKRGKLGGMLRYGIPLYRLPDQYLDYDIDAILKAGVDTVMNTEIGKDISFEELRAKYDSVLITIGAHGHKSLAIPGEESTGVISAVKLLSDMGDEIFPVFADKNIVVIGGGNVAMDAARTSVRLGAKSVKCVYRRRVEDMTALREEVEGAVAEGVDIMPLSAPVRIESDGNGNANALTVQPQMIGTYRAGRPAPRKADKPEERIECDIVIVAIGQAIQSEYFSGCGLALNYDMLEAELSCAVPGMPGVFAGGDCTFGPATVIRAIEAGKVSAANIDNYLGYAHKITLGVEIPPASQKHKVACGRATSLEREAIDRKNDFEMFERALSEQEMHQECARCLRCDHFGMGTLRDGRVYQW